jgi:hypothetical protein
VKTEPSHEELQEMLSAAALEILDGPELDTVLQHVRHCEECTRLLGEYEEVAGTLPLLLPDQPLQPDRSDAVRARLLARARVDRTPGARRNRPTTGRPHLRASRSDRWTGWMGWMVAAGLAGVLLVHHSIHRPINYGWLVAGLLTVLVIGFGIYARLQWTRAAALEDRLAALERRGTLRDTEIEP